MGELDTVGFVGCSGCHIAVEAVRRGHGVIGMSRRPGDAPGVEVRTGSNEDGVAMAALFADADAVVIAVHASADGRPILALRVAEIETRCFYVGPVCCCGALAPGGAVSRHRFGGGVLLGARTACRHSADRTSPSQSLTRSRRLGIK